MIPHNRSAFPFLPTKNLAMIEQKVKNLHLLEVVDVTMLLRGEFSIIAIGIPNRICAARINVNLIPFMWIFLMNLNVTSCLIAWGDAFTLMA